MVETAKELRNANLFGNNWFLDLLGSNQGGIVQNGKKILQIRKADGFDDFAWSESVGCSAFHLEASTFVLQENVLAWTLIRNGPPYPNSGFRRTVSAILGDTA